VSIAVMVHVLVRVGLSGVLATMFWLSDFNE